MRRTALGVWTVHVWSGKAGEIATGTVDDASGEVTEAWTGPQVAWRMARGSTARSAATKINEPWLWLAFCALFLLGLVDWRRPLWLRTLDLFALVSLSVSLWFFNHGNIFAAMPLAYPPLAVGARPLRLDRHHRPPARGAPVWPVWLLLATTVFLAGFRIGLNVRASNVIDVGYSGVIGADRIWHGQSPYGHFPQEGDRTEEVRAGGQQGEVRDRVQANGRCETANPLGDTYGPVSYLAYIPGYLLFGWSHKWDTLPAVHFTSILFDLIALLGLGARRPPPRRPASRRRRCVRLGGVAVHAVRVELEHERLDRAGAPRLGLPALDEPDRARRGGRRLRLDEVRVAARAAALDRLSRSAPPAPGRAHAARLPARDASPSSSCSSSSRHRGMPRASSTTARSRFQVGRDSPFSLWDWRQYHAKGLPDLHLVQRVLEGAARRSARSRSRSVSAAPLAAAHGRAHRGGADRV